MAGQAHPGFLQLQNKAQKSIPGRGRETQKESRCLYVHSGMEIEDTDSVPNVITFLLHDLNKSFNSGLALDDKRLKLVMPH